MRSLQSAVLISLIGVAALPAGAADPLGRLFTTPDQRRLLDALRNEGTDIAPAPGPLTDPVARPMEKQVVLNGIVRRSRGPDVVWVNGSRARNPSDRVRLRSGPDRSNTVTVEDAADGTTARLKPGQYWEPATGRVADCHGCGAAAAPGADGKRQPTEDTADKP